MKLKGKYELVVEVELPDGTYTPISNLIDFCLNNNYRVVKTLAQYPDIKYFHLGSNGCLETGDGIYWIRNYFIRVGYINNNDEILDCASIRHDLYMFDDWAREYLNNSDKYKRDVKIDMLDE